MDSQVRVRFAPSPTGYLHVGGARTALFNYLYAKHHNGTFILRIEDTDRNRFQEGALEEIFTSLQWLGIPWDEGPEAGGDYGPYFQSERTELYKKCADQLLKSGHAYRCFCTAERLQKIREEQQKAKVAHASGYDRHCRDLSDEEIEEKLAVGTPYVVRLKIPLGREVTFTDAIRGEITYRSDMLDDLVLLKSDGFPTYHLANVVDDHSMEITHVLRGDEWIASTPRHILLYEAFGWTPPQFAHMPVILSSDGGKLSKRKGAASVMDYKQNGYLPEALFNFLTLLGWAPGDDREKMTKDEIAGAFTLDRISPKSSVFDEKKLDWMNGLYMQERSVDSIIEAVITLWKDLGYVGQDEDNRHYFETVIGMLKDRSKRITDLAENARYFFRDPEEYEEKAVKKHWKEGAVDAMRVITDRMEKLPRFDHAALENMYREYAEESGISGGKLIHPTRLAVSGVSFGPGLFELLEALGKERVVRRMKAAIEWIGGNKG
jgi:glutamyl-tRNA synthetase